MTWFRNQLEVDWIECNEQSHVQTMADQVEAGWHDRKCWRWIFMQSLDPPIERVILVGVLSMGTRSGVCVIPWMN